MKSLEMSSRIKGHRYVVGVDPSGNFKEGSGHTGLAVYDVSADEIVCCGYTYAGDYARFEEYYWATWKQIVLLSKYFNDAPMSIEDYVLYGTKATAQINSQLETPRIIGFLMMQCWLNNIDVYIRPAVRVKKRWNEDVLVAYGYVHKKDRSYYLTVDSDTPLMTHELDAIKHAVHCGKFEVRYDS